MARAFTEKTKAEQLANHTVSSAAQYESTCTRCGGLMVQDFYLDLLDNIGESKFAAKRCVQCGEVVDPVILRNRGTRQEPMTAHFGKSCSVFELCFRKRLTSMLAAPGQSWCSKTKGGFLMRSYRVLQVGLGVALMAGAISVADMRRTWC